MDETREAPEPGVNTFEDTVRDFLLSEQRLIEKEMQGEPTTGSRSPTEQRFRLVDEMLDEHDCDPIQPSELENKLRALAGAADQEGADQITQTLGRWNEFRLLDQPTAQRDPYQPSE